MSKLALIILLAVVGTANADNACPKMQVNQVAPMTSASTAIEIAKNAMLETYKADYLAGFGPFTAEKTDNIWHVHGSLPLDTYGGTPEVEICATTGKVIDIYHTQ